MEFCLIPPTANIDELRWKCTFIDKFFLWIIVLDYVKIWITVCRMLNFFCKYSVCNNEAEGVWASFLRFQGEKQWFCQSVVTWYNRQSGEDTENNSSDNQHACPGFGGNNRVISFLQDSYTVRKLGNFAYGTTPRILKSIIGQWMVLFDAVPQTSAIEVGIDLGGQYRFMSQHLLYLTNTGSTL